MTLIPGAHSDIRVDTVVKNVVSVLVTPVTGKREYLFHPTYPHENREGGERMKITTKLLVAALLAVVALAGVVSIIQTSAYNGPSQDCVCDDGAQLRIQLRQGACDQCQGTDANGYQMRSRVMAQQGDQTGNAHRYCYRHGSDE
jgi:hypothetical protein